MIHADAVRQLAGTSRLSSIAQAASSTASPSHWSSSTATPSHWSNQLVQRRLGQTGLQPKLTVNRPGDVFEQEADRVADAVTRMDAAPMAESGSPPVAQGKCAKCEEEKMVQRKCAKCDEEEK